MNTYKEIVELRFDLFYQLFKRLQQPGSQEKLNIICTTLLKQFI